MKILLVDDEKDSRHYVARFLDKWGHETVEADHGGAALQLVENQRFDLVLSDIHMPVMNGLELLQKVRGGSGDDRPEVVLFTGFNEVQSAIDALRGGAYDYILKPVDARELLYVIERVGEHQSLVRQNAILTEHFENAIAVETREIKAELEKLRQNYYEVLGIGQIIVQSSSMKRLYEAAAILAGDRDVPVLIEGETGTGKELVARYLHFANNQSDRPFVDINCAAIPPGLFESELFGYEAGAFTGAFPKGKKGKLDLASGGTLFLDEITDMPLEMQAKMLRVLQEKSFFRVSGLKKIECDVRLICATNANIRERVEEGLFRKDLYYRLATAHLKVPPLRERTDDIVPLAQHFMEEYARQKKKMFSSISDKCRDILCSYSWPGNVRELQNTIEYAVLMYNDSSLLPGHLNLQSGAQRRPITRHEPGGESWNDFRLPQNSLPLDEFTNQIIMRALDMHGGNKTRTASYLGMSLRALSYRLKQI